MPPLTTCPPPSKATRPGSTVRWPNPSTNDVNTLPHIHKMPQRPNGARTSVAHSRSIPKPPHDQEESPPETEFDEAPVLIPFAAWAEHAACFATPDHSPPTHAITSCQVNGHGHRRRKAGTGCSLPLGRPSMSPRHQPLAEHTHGRTSDTRTRRTRPPSHAPTHARTHSLTAPLLRLPCNT